MIKIKKVMMITFALLLFALSYSQQIQANAPQTVEAAEKDTENTLKSQQETNSKNGQEDKTTEETLTITEKKAKEESNAPPILMTEETVNKNNLIEIGTTKNGTKIWSSASKEVVDAFIKNPINYQTRAAGNSSGMLTWMGTYSTPMIFLDGVGWVYCIQPYETFPSNNWYDDSSWLEDAVNGGAGAILTWGFPRNHGGQHGLSDEEAYLRTFVSINAYLGNYNRSTVTNYNDGYVNMLIEKGDIQDFPNETYTVHSPQNRESHYNATTSRLETDLYHITGAVGQFWLEQLPAGFYMVGEDGNPYSSLSIGSRFRLVTNSLTYEGQVNFDVKTDIRPRGAIVFRSQGVQDLLSLGGRDPLPAFGTHAIFKAATGSLDLVKLVDTQATIPDATATHDLSKVVIKLTSTANTYNKNFNLTNEGRLEVKDLLLGTYTIKEVSAPTSLELNKTTFNITINPGETTNFTLVNNEDIGALKISKKITKTTTNQATVTHDFTKVKVKVESAQNTITYNQDYNLNTKGELLIQNLPVGRYKITETEVPPTMQLNKTPLTIIVQSKNIVTIPIGTTLTNTETTTHINIKKAINNPTATQPNKNYTPDLTKIKINIKSINPNVSYNQTLNLNAKGELPIKNLPYSRYEITEAAVPDDMELDKTIHTITANTHNQTYEVTFTNTLKKSWLKIVKKDNNTGKVPNVKYIITSDILRWPNNTPKVFKYDTEQMQYAKTPEKQGTLVDPKNGIYYQPDQTTKQGPTYTTDSDGTFTTNPILYGFKNLWVTETETPRYGHLFIDPQPKLIKLQPEKTVTVPFENIIKEQGQIQINKQDEDNKKVAWYFDIYVRYPGEATDTYIETIATSGLNGIGRSSILPRNDKNGNQFPYKVCEQNHPLYAAKTCINVTDDMWNSGRSIWIINITNNYKKIGAELWKTVESNMLGTTAKGTEITWKNSKGEHLGTFKYDGNGKAIISPTIRIDKLLDGKNTYIEETKFSQGASKQTVKFKVKDIDFTTLADKQIIKLNTEATAIINKATETLIDKINPDTKKVQGAKLTLKDKTGKIIHEWITTDTPQKITGLDKNTTYQVCESLIPPGYKQPKTMCATFTTSNDGSVTTFNLINEYTSLIIHKKGV
ncbi:MAG: MSCRAMM family protein, partial [Culicoidibacterales bacterium]